MTSPTQLTFIVHGIPKPQGSVKAFAVNGKARIAPASGSGFAQWRNAVAEVAARHAPTDGPLDGPLALDIVFRFPMPASRPKAVRAEGRCPKTTAPDIDKLVRTVCDALQAAGVIADDARIVYLCARKVEVTDWTGVDLDVRKVDVS